MSSHVLSNSSHANRGEVVDGESCIAWVIGWKESIKVRLQKVFLEAVLQFLHPHSLREILKENFNENTTAGGRLFLVEMNNRHDVPSNSIGAYKMAEKPCNVPESVCFVSMNCIVIFRKGFFEELGPKSVDLGESLPNEAIEL